MGGELRLGFGEEVTRLFAVPGDLPELVEDGGEAVGLGAGGEDPLLCPGLDRDDVVEDDEPVQRGERQSGRGRNDAEVDVAHPDQRGEPVELAPHRVDRAEQEPEYGFGDHELEVPGGVVEHLLSLDPRQQRVLQVVFRGGGPLDVFGEAGPGVVDGLEQDGYDTDLEVSDQRGLGGEFVQGAVPGGVLARFGRTPPPGDVFGPGGPELFLQPGDGAVVDPGGQSPGRDVVFGRQLPAGLDLGRVRVGVTVQLRWCRALHGSRPKLPLPGVPGSGSGRRWMSGSPAR